MKALLTWGGGGGGGGRELLAWKGPFDLGEPYPGFSPLG